MVFRETQPAEGDKNGSLFKQPRLRTQTMSRELKRVPLEFDQPIGEIWGGYISPDSRPCPAGDECKTGYTASGQWLRHLMGLLFMLPDDIDAGKALHPWLSSMEYRPDFKPSEDIRGLIDGLTGSEPSSFGSFNPSDVYKGTEKLLKAAGVDENWGTCPTCQGLAYHPDDEQKIDDWVGTEPPTGPGYQMWETTSEGSPKTPVFETLDELAEYCAKHCTTFASYTASAGEWKRMLGDGFVSTVIVPGVIAI